MIFFYQYFLSVQVPVWPGPGYTLEIQGVAKKSLRLKMLILQDLELI